MSQTTPSSDPCRRALAGIRLARALVTVKGPAIELMRPDGLRPRLVVRLHAAGVAVPRFIDYGDPAVWDRYAEFELTITSHSSGYIAGGGFLLVGQLDVSRPALIEVNGELVRVLAGFANHVVARVSSGDLVAETVGAIVDELIDAILTEVAAADGSSYSA